MTSGEIPFWHKPLEQLPITHSLLLLHSTPSHLTLIAFELEEHSGLMLHMFTIQNSVRLQSGSEEQIYPSHMLPTTKGSIIQARVT